MTEALTIYQKMDDPLAAAKELGEAFHKSAIMNVNTPGDGVVLALTCMSEGMTPLDFVRKYHIINGRPSMRADRMLAEFRTSGGKVTWLNLGDDGKEARAKFEYDGQELEVAFTIEDGKRVAGDKFKKAGASWQVDPGAMLRARLVSKAVRILAPELIAGVYEPGELQDSLPSATGSQRSPQEAAARKAELQSQEGEVIDTTVSVVTDRPAEAAPFESPPEPAVTPDPDPNAKCTNEQLQELVALGDKLGKSIQETRDGLCQAAKVDNPADMTHEQATKLIERFKGLLAGK